MSTRKCKNCKYWTKQYWLSQLGNDPDNQYPDGWKNCSIVGSACYKTFGKTTSPLAHVIIGNRSIGMAAELVTSPEYGCEQFKLLDLPESYKT